jgi:hypothetical protein
MRRGLGLAVLLAGLATVLTGSAGVGKGRGERSRRRHIPDCLVHWGLSACVNFIDPAIALSTNGEVAIGQILRASLVRYPDKPPPAGYRLLPELAAGLPRISAGGRVYTFRIRKGVRFSTGAPVTARDLARRFAVHALAQAERIAAHNGRRRYSLFTGDSAHGVGGSEAGAAAADRPGRVQTHVRVPDDRRRREREGARDVHGTRERDDHLRPLWHLMPGNEEEAAGLLDAYLEAATDAQTGAQSG